MSDLSISSADTQRSLDDLKQEHELKLQRTRADYQQREVQEQAAGEAAISHIKKNTEARIDQVEREADGKIRQENDQLSKTYSDLKRRSAEQIESTQARVNIAEQSAQREIAHSRDGEILALKESQDQLKTFIDQQKQRQTAVAGEAKVNLDKTVQQNTQEIVQVKNSGVERKSKLEAESKRTLESLRSQEDSLYQQTHESGEQRLGREKTLEAQKLESDRNEKTHTLNDLSKKYQTAMATEAQGQEHRMTEQTKKDTAAIKSNHEHSLRTNEELLARDSAETQRVQTEGESDVRTRQEKFDAIKKKQETTNQATLKDLDHRLLDEEAKAQKLAVDKENLDAQKLEQTMRQRRSEFDQRFKTAEQVNKESLFNQREQYLGQLYKQKVRFESQSAKETERSDDPFYQLKTFEPKLTEQRGAYVLKAKVPAHEKDTVDIIVKEDHITLSAKRSYQEAIVDPEGNRTTTNSYQTYRQNFKLAVPVVSNKAFRKVEDDGSIIVIVPKKGSPPSAEVV